MPKKENSDPSERPVGSGSRTLGGVTPEKSATRVAAYILDPKFATRLKTLFHRFGKKRKDDKEKGLFKTLIKK